MKQPVQLTTGAGALDAALSAISAAIEPSMTASENDAASNNFFTSASRLNTLRFYSFWRSFGVKAGAADLLPLLPSGHARSLA
jgi:hypothetical protein